MAIAAVYVSSSEFSVVGEHTGDFKAGQKVQLLNIGGSGSVVHVSSVTFSAGSNASTVTVSPAVVLPNLYRVKLGLTYAQSTGLHFHHDDDDAGRIPAGDLSEDQVTALGTIPLPATNANKVLSVKPDATGWEVKAISGTAHQVIVSMGTGYIELSLPQDVDTSSSPAFQDMVLTGTLQVANIIASGTVKLTPLTGVVVARGTDAAIAMATTTEGAVLRLKPDGTAYEFAVLGLSDISDASDLEMMRFMGV